MEREHKPKEGKRRWGKRRKENSEGKVEGGERKPTKPSPPSHPKKSLSWVKFGILLFLSISCGIIVQKSILKKTPIPEAVVISLPDPPTPLPSNDVLSSVFRKDNGLPGPEAFAEIEYGGENYLFCSLIDGRIARVHLPAKGSPDLIGEIVYIARLGEEKRGNICDTYNYSTEPQCGRPLGLTFDPTSGNLLVAEAYSGIWIIEKSQLFYPSEGYSPVPFLLFDDLREQFPLFQNAEEVFFNDLVLVGEDLYITISSLLYSRRDVLLATFDGRSTGVLISQNLATKKTSLLLQNLPFPNGIISHGENLLISCTSSASILSFSPSTEKVTTFASNLPCLPDNLSYFKANKKIIIGCAMQRTQPFSFYDFTASSPSIRQTLLKFLSPATIFSLSSLIPKKGVILFLDDKSGEVVDWWGDGGQNAIPVVSEVAQAAEILFLGSWRHDQGLVYVPFSETPLTEEK